MLVGSRDVFLIQPAGSGKYLIFSLLQYFSTSLCRHLNKKSSWQSGALLLVIFSSPALCKYLHHSCLANISITVAFRRNFKLPSTKAHHASLYYSSQNFPSTCENEVSRLLGASQSASKSENSDRCKYSFPHLHWKEEYPIYRKFCFVDRKPFHLITFSFLNHFLQSRTRHN